MTTKLDFDDDSMSIMEMIAAMAALLDEPGRPDVHWHYCTKKGCGHAWQHDRAKIGHVEGAYEKAHTCPKCQQGVCYNKCRTEGEALKRAKAEAA